ncbi:MAG: hypothetical protein HY560_01785 [Gemmatimonadetes bacterium]|nr:hypothetical protein [Gemmatimonadota bacterium]
MSRIFALGVFTLALWAQTDAVVGGFYDDGIYVSLAKSLADGHGYRNIHLPGAPPGVHYPPLYPLLLSLLWRVWPSFAANVALFQLFDAAMLGLAALLIARTSAKWPLAPALRYGALALGFTAFPLLTIVGVRLSEPLFLALFAAAIATADRQRTTAAGAVGAGALAGLAMLARSIGIAVAGGCAVALWLRGGVHKALLGLATAAVVVAPWLVWTAVHAGEIDPRIAANYGTYVGEAGQAGLAGLVQGVHLRALSPLGRVAIPALPGVLWYPVALLALALLGWGAIRLWSASPALIASLTLYLIVVGAWHYVPDRFIWIVTPFVAVLLAAGARAAWGRGKVGQIAVGVVGVALAAGYGLREIRSLSERQFARTAEVTGTPIRWLAPAIARGTPPDAVVATASEAAIFLYSGRRAVPSTLFRWRGAGTVELPPDSTVRYFCDVGVTHIALSSPRESVASVIERLKARGDSSVVPLFILDRGPALYRFRCPA